MMAYYLHFYMLAFTIRPFHNTDPPQILELLRRVFPLIPHSMSSLQEGLFALPYSEYSGFFVAVSDDEPKKHLLGFAMAGAAPHSDMMRLDGECGLIRFVATDPEADDSVTSALIEECEKFLQKSGAKKIMAGVLNSYFPFFMGFFGLLEPLCAARTKETLLNQKTLTTKNTAAEIVVENAPHNKIEKEKIEKDEIEEDATPIFLGVDAAETELALERVLAARGFYPQDQVHRFFLPLKNFHQKLTVKVARQRSAIELVFSDNPKPRHWWDACLMAYHQWVEVKAYPQATTLEKEETRLKNPVARLLLCVSVPRGTSLYSAPRRAGLVDVYVAPEHRRSGVMTYVLGETLRCLSQEWRVGSVEAYVASEFAPMLAFLTHAGWQSLPASDVLVKEF